MTPPAEAPRETRRWYVELSRRGKKVALTLNGGVMFKDPTLAADGAIAAMKRDGWTRAVVKEFELDEVRETTNGVDRFWKLIGTVTITAPKKPRKEQGHV